MPQNIKSEANSNLSLPLVIKIKLTKTQVSIKKDDGRNVQRFVKDINNDKKCAKSFSGSKVQGNNQTKMHLIQHLTRS